MLEENAAKLMQPAAKKLLSKRKSWIRTPPLPLHSYTPAPPQRNDVRHVTHSLNHRKSTPYVKYNHYQRHGMAVDAAAKSYT